jgi:DNA-binding XRE family transcriptional regulator
MGKRSGLAARRKAVGHSQESLAEALHTSRSTVARWERGEVAPQPATRAPLAEILRISLSDLDDLLEGVPAKKPGESFRVAPTEPVGAAHIEGARDRVKQLLTMEHSFGGMRVASIALDSAHAFERRIEEAGIRPGYHSDAHAAAAELFEVAGWQLVDAARPDDVDRANSRALHHAAAAGDHSMEIFVIQNESMHLCETGRATEALYLTRGVLEQSLSPRLSTLFHVREARALGRRGDSEAARIWAKAMAEYGDGVRESDPYWSWWINDEQMQLQKAALFRDLGKYDTAIDTWQGYLTARSDDLYLTLVVAQLAHAQARAGAWVDAESTVGSLIDGADEIHSGRAITRIDQLAADVKRSPSAPGSLREATRLLASFMHHAHTERPVGSS